MKRIIEKDIVMVNGVYFELTTEERMKLQRQEKVTINGKRQRRHTWMLVKGN